jgi:hypothetical protein
LHPNEETLRRGYEGFGRGDVETIRRDSTPDLVWHVRGSTAMAGDRIGPDEVIRFLGEYMTLTDFTFGLEVVRIFADDEYGIVLLKQTGTAAGHPIDSLVTHVHKFRDGKICEASFLIDQMLEVDKALTEAFATKAAAGLIEAFAEVA